MNNACIILLCNTPWDWSADYGAQTAKELAKNNTVICFFWFDAKSIWELIKTGTLPTFFKKPKEHILLYSGIHVLPFRRYQWVRASNIYINVGIIRLYVWFAHFYKKFTGCYVWFFDPRQHGIAQRFGSHYLSVYDIVDYWRGSSLSSKEERINLLKNETAAVKESTIVTVNSQTLYSVYKEIRKDIHLVPLGFRINDYRQASTARPMARAPKHPNIGYVGAINERLDYTLLIYLAKHFPSYYFVFAGPKIAYDDAAKAACEKQLFSLPNVIYKGSISKKITPGLIRTFDVCIIPYDMRMAFNTYAFPMKVMEYLYMGKPVISTPIKELKRFPEFIYIAMTTRQWEQSIRMALYRVRPIDIQKKQILFAESHSWENKLSSIGAAISSRVVR